jgi:hypothetical protein
MDERTWLDADNPQYLQVTLAGLGGHGTRKYRLAAVACARRVWSRLTEDHQHALEVAERYADGEAKFPELCAARKLCPPTPYFQNSTEKWLDPAYRDGIRSLRMILVHLLGQWSPDVMLTPSFLRRGGYYWKEEAEVTAECAALCRILRDIFSNPHRPAPAIASEYLTWNGGTVTNLARTIYAERRLPEGTLDPERLNVLADALEDAGCGEVTILGHLREPTAHFRGCWVIDQILRKE